MDVIHRSASTIMFQKAMVFIDETNLFYRLESSKLKLKRDISKIVDSYVSSRQIVRIYLYTSEPHFNKAKNKHGDCISNGLRVIFGDAVPKADGNYKEKGVDALLVADLVYHAAVKNYDYALIVSTDTDFVHPIERVEDFGCRTGVLGVCSNIPDKLINVADDAKTINEEQLIKRNDAIKNS